MAGPCRAIESRPELVYAYTNKSNAIAVVSDGTRVLGLGDIAAHELARCAEERGIEEDNIICTMDEWETVPRVAVATALKAQEQGLAGLLRTRDELHDMAVRKIREAQSAMQVLMKEGVIAAAPDVQRGSKEENTQRCPCHRHAGLRLHPAAADEAEKKAWGRRHVTVRAGAVTDGDYFAVGKTVEVSGTIKGDLYVAGGRIQRTGG